MAQSGWRLPDDLLKRVRVRCAEEGVRQNAWVERALEKALGAADGMKAPESVLPHGGQSSPAPSRASAKPLSREAQGVKNVLDSTLDAMGERVAARAKPKPAALGKGLVASRPKGK
jgi:DNA mismatch repair protein MutH